MSSNVDWWTPVVQVVAIVWTVVVTPILTFMWMKGHNDAKRIQAENGNYKK